MATAIKDNKELVQRVNEGLNDQSREVFTTHHTSDVVLHDSGEEIHGVDAALERETALWRAFPDLHHTLEDIIAEGDRVAYRFTATGTHEGQFQGIEPTGQEVTVMGHGTVRVEDGKLAEVWLTYDKLDMMAQLGIVEATP